LYHDARIHERPVYLFITYVPDKERQGIFLSFKVLENLEGYQVLDFQELFTNSADFLFTNTPPHLYVFGLEQGAGFNTYKCPVKSSYSH
jgi:hypothetical protein